MWGDQELFDEHVRHMIGRAEIVCGGDAVSIDLAGRPTNRECLGCGTQWAACEAPKSITGRLC